MAEMHCNARDELRKQAKVAILNAQDEQKRQNNKKVKTARRYTVGDICGYQNDAIRDGRKIKNEIDRPIPSHSCWL